MLKAKNEPKRLELENGKKIVGLRTMRKKTSERTEKQVRQQKDQGSNN